MLSEVLIDSAAPLAAGDSVIKVTVVRRTAFFFSAGQATTILNLSALLLSKVFS